MSFLNNNANSEYCLTYRPSILIYHGHLLLLEMLIILLFHFLSLYTFASMRWVKIKAFFFFLVLFLLEKEYFSNILKQYYLGCMYVSMVIFLHYLSFLLCSFILNNLCIANRETMLLSFTCYLTLPSFNPKNCKE